MTIERIQLRRDWAAQWTAVNPVLAQGEPGFEYDSGLLKMGDGVTTWTALPYAAVTPDGLNAATADAITADGPTKTALSGAIGAGVVSSFAPRRQVNLADYGAKFDRRPMTVTTTASSATIASSDAGFTAGDVGKVVFIMGAGPSGGALVASVASVQSGSSATLGATAAAAVTSVEGFIGTNNDSAWTAAFNEISAGGGTIMVPAGDGMHATQKTPPDNVRIVGAGRDITTLHPIGGTAGFYRVGTADAPITNVHFADLTIDGDLQTNGASSGTKGTAMYFQRGCTYTDVTVRNAAGSGFGNDSHQDCWYVRCLAESNGRIGTTASPGHSGFGFGTGGWTVENVYLIDCVGRDNMRHGLFFEWQPNADQSNTYQSAGAQVIGGRYSGNAVTGISDQNVGGLILSNVHIVDNVGEGFSVTTTAALNNIAYDGQVSNCVITGNGGDGVDLDWTHTPLPVIGHYRLVSNLIQENAGNGVNVRAAASVTVPLVKLSGNTIARNAKNGIRVAAAGTGGTLGGFDRLSVDNNEMYDNGQSGSGGTEKSGLYVAATLTNPNIRGNTSGNTGTNTSQSYGAYISSSTPASAVTGGVLVNNDLRGNAASALFGFSQISTTTAVRDNDGFGPGVLNPITGTSPITRTCGASREQHMLVGGTITQLSINGQNTVASGSLPSFSTILYPGDVMVVTYSATPVWKYRLV